MSTEPACSWREPLRWVCAWKWQSPSDWLWLVWAALTWALALPAIAKQELQPPVAGPLAVTSLRVEQHVFLDPTRSMTLADIPAEAFKTFSPLRHLPMAGKTVWLRLSFARADGEPAPSGSLPLFLGLLPPVFDSVVLHTPDPQATSGWKATNLGDLARFKAIPLGDLAQNGIVFLQISAADANGLVAYAGTQEEVSRYNHRMDITIAMLSTMLVFAWVTALWKVIPQFNHLALAASVFFPFVLFRLWLTLGYGPDLLGLNPAWASRLFVPSVSANVLSTGAFFILLAAEVFQSPRWFSWLRSWVALGTCNLILSFFQPDWAIWIIDGLMLGGALLLLLSLMLAAVRTPQSLKTWPARVAFLILVLVAGAGLLSALQLQGLSPSADPLQRSDAVQNTLLLRALMPIALIGIASWTYQRMRSERASRMQADLMHTTASLELESKRLERQRNFTAMLAHELKNPLTASQMALSGIQQRLADDDPTQQRAEKIKASLQEINAIVDRCAEVDGYEQGQMPMAVHTFAVQQLLDLVEASNPSERIYTLTRGLPEGAALTSDLHYIKLILNNLLSNALKYSSPDSLVELQLCSRHAEQSMLLDISVTNEIGPAGVPQPDRLFERFYRAESARNQSGAGLGLWLSQALAGALGTRIVSQTEDNWISFTLTLTLNDPQS
jgi:signal transduction histidine kinase